ncbi:hypothetical protein MMC28_008496 [Mycoblastus sanguinarius]|nr:hypothetical protein [Mycoblastus sanguinarius]
MVAVPGENGEAIPYSTGTFMAIAAFTAVAWYNVAELNVQVFLTFKRHRGLYFWSLIISSYGCLLHALGFLLKFFQLTSNDYISVSIITVGWYCMVTGQAVVLYSRLHLVVREQKVLRGILAMIIVDAICFHIPTTILTYGSNSKDAAKYTSAFNVVEKLQMTAFCTQEFIISGVYVYSTIRLLRPVYHGRTRKIMTQLIWINLIIICMDVCLLAVEYSNIYDIEATLKAMVYSIKLKLEFAVLNQLMTLANSSVNSHQQLHIEEGNEKPSKPTAGRSKSTEYISHRYQKPSKKSRDNLTKPAPPILHTSYSTSRVPAHNRSNSFGPNNKNRFQWIPTLDRNCVVETKHIENTDEALNVFTNPAACFKPGRQRPDGYPPHDGLGGIPDSPILSPDDDERPVHRGRAPPPPNLDLRSSVLPSGVLRSTRPSVSDWAHGPDSEASPNSDEMQLNPYETVKYTPQSPGSVRAGRDMAVRSMGGVGPTGMDFMTSALRE